jgi:hypothetical protein
MFVSGAQQPSLPESPPVPSRGFLIAALAGLALSTLCDLFSIVAGVRLRLTIGGAGAFLTAPQRDVALYETAAHYQAVVVLPCAIAFVVWFFQMRRATGPLAPDRFRKGPGWAIGAWCIPLANLWLPYRVAADMWGAATPLPADGEPYRPPRVWPLNLWWGLFVFSSLFNTYAQRRDDADTLTHFRDGLTRYIVADVLHIVAAAAAAYFSVQLTAMQRDKALRGPFGTGALRSPQRLGELLAD